MRTDLYQVVAFATGFQSAAAAIINFRCRDSADIAPAVQVGGLPVQCFVWEALELLNPEDAGKRLAVQVTAWLEQVTKVHSALTT